MRVRLTPEAEADLVQASAWYAIQGDWLSQGFQRAVEQRIDVITRVPFAFPIARKSIRAALLSRFPYCLYYVPKPSEILVIACTHTSRDPIVWQFRELQ